VKNLFLIDGASGTGKSDLLKWVMENNANDIGFVIKGTTRAQREYERNDPEILLDLEFLTDDEFESKEFDYIYTYSGARYGFSSSQITAALLERENVFVIVRSNTKINEVARDYAFLNVVPVFIYTDKTELRNRLESSKLDPELVAFRMDRSDIALRDYYAHPEAYQDVLINNSSREIFHNTIDRLILKYGNRPSINPYLIAVMMSFNPGNRKLDDYFDAMDAAVTSISSHYECRRLDKVPGSPRIAKEFRNLIASSRLVIVDLTENKQSVYYELGYAHATKKACLITAEQGTQPYVYPREHKIIFYESGRDLRMKLAGELKGLLRGIPGL
jgi:guanylate kinase